MILSDRSIRAIFKRVFSCGLGLLVGMGICQGRAVVPAHRLLPLPYPTLADTAPEFTLSPNGCWIAYFGANGQSRPTLILYNVLTRRCWKTSLRQQEEGGASLTWRADSAALAVATQEGWAAVRPVGKRVQRVTRTAPGSDSCAAWSQKTGQLACFDGDWGGGTFQVWNGKHITHQSNWIRDFGVPEARAWQCEWRPDGKALLFRFYGHAERDSESAGHTLVLDPKTGKDKYPSWGAEAGPAHWLDNARLAYPDNNEGLGSAPLTVDSPQTRKRRVWRQKVIQWALVPGRNVLWALTDTGDLSQTSTQKRLWKQVAHVTPAWDGESVRLLLAPQGKYAAVATGPRVTLVSAATGAKRHWLVRVPDDNYDVLGWLKGQTLPLLAVHPSQNGPWQLWQLL